MLKTSSSKSSVVLQSLIDVASKDKVGFDNDKIRILSTFFIFKKLIKAEYFFLNAEKTFNYFEQAFT